MAVKKFFTTREKAFITCKHTMEKKLYDLMQQDALQPSKNLYILEVKTKPAIWERIDRTYPEISYLKAIYHHQNMAAEAKSIIKWFFNTTYAPKTKKKPIRIRKIQDFYKP